jgi:hypothetical protein
VIAFVVGTAVAITNRLDVHGLLAGEHRGRVHAHEKLVHDRGPRMFVVYRAVISIPLAAEERILALVFGETG